MKTTTSRNNLRPKNTGNSTVLKTTRVDATTINTAYETVSSLLTIPVVTSITAPNPALLNGTTAFNVTDNKLYIYYNGVWYKVQLA